MSEIFSAVASGAGLVSLSMQLLDSAQKLKGFYDTARDAPETVRRLSFEMETISMLLRQFEGFRRDQIFGDQILNRCIESCEQAVSRISDSVGKVDRLLRVPKTRTLGKMIMGFKEPEIRQLLEEMEHAKSLVLLAFSNYQQRYSIHRDSRHEASLREQFAAQAERLSILERMVTSGNVAVLGRVDALASQHLLGPPQPTDQQQSALALNTMTKRTGSDERRKRKWLCKFRVSLPPWLMDRVWEFGLRQAEDGWTAQLYPITVRPEGTYVFDAVRAGNVDTVRRLLDAGELSLRDHEVYGRGYHRNLLEMAVRNGHLELWSFLLSKDVFFRDDEVMRSAFKRYRGAPLSTPWSTARRSTESFSSLFIGENSMNVEFQDDRTANLFVDAFIPAWFLTTSCLRDILSAQTTDIARLSLDRRLSIVLNAIGWPAEIFTSIFRHDDPVSLATTATGNGKTALHWAASHFGHHALHSPRQPRFIAMARTYQEILVRLIRAGADLHARFPKEDSRLSPLGRPTFTDTDAFLMFLRSFATTFWFGFYKDRLPNAIQWWGQTLVEAGCTLAEYVAIENRYLTGLRSALRCDSQMNGFIPVSLVVSANGTLMLEAVDLQRVPVWRACWTELPGSWPASFDLPETIIWDPESEEAQDGIVWKRAEGHRVETAPYLVGLEEAHAPEFMPISMLLDAWQTLFDGVQDDHGPLATATWREFKLRGRGGKKHTRRRSASAPPPSFRWDYSSPRPHRMRRDMLVDLRHAWWAGRAHKCPFDGRWSICISLEDPDSWRWCMGGRGYYDSQGQDLDTWHPLRWHNTWEERLLSDVVNVEVAERFAKRVCPEHLDVLERTRRSARERDALGLPGSV